MKIQTDITGPRQDKDFIGWGGTAFLEKIIPERRFRRHILRDVNKKKKKENGSLLFMRSEPEQPQDFPSFRPSSWPNFRPLFV
jgi:hypothetical protein